MKKLKLNNKLKYFWMKNKDLKRNYLVNNKGKSITLNNLLGISHLILKYTQVLHLEAKLEKKFLIKLS